jgi:hypothetical protein
MAKKAHQAPRTAGNRAAAKLNTARTFSRNGKVIKFGKSAPQAAGGDSELTALFGVEPFLRNQVTKEQVDHLRLRIDSEGLPKVAESLGINQITVLRLCAGFGHRLMPGSAEKIRGYFGGGTSNTNSKRG